MKPLCCAVAVLATLQASVSGQAPDTRSELNALLDKALKAMGGADKLADLKLVRWKGNASFDINGMQIELTHQGGFQGEDKFRLEGTATANGMTNSGLLVVNGDKAWVSAGAGRVNEIPKKQAAVFTQFFSAARVPFALASLKDKKCELSHLGEVKLDERPALGVTAARKGRPDVNVFLDKETGLPVKVETRLTDFTGNEVALEMRLSDYKEFEGLKLFSKVAFKVGEVEFATELSEVRREEMADDSLFAKPE